LGQRVCQHAQLLPETAHGPTLEYHQLHSSWQLHALTVCNAPRCTELSAAAAAETAAGAAAAATANEAGCAAGVRFCRSLSIPKQPLN
jgi:hypothetical protein